MSERRCETCDAWVVVAPLRGDCRLMPEPVRKHAEEWCMQWTPKAAAQASAQGVEAFARIMSGEGET